jgi:hypothetical protein
MGLFGTIGRSPSFPMSKPIPLHMANYLDMTGFSLSAAKSGYLIPALAPFFSPPSASLIPVPLHSRFPRLHQKESPPPLLLVLFLVCLSLCLKVLSGWSSLSLSRVCIPLAFPSHYMPRLLPVSFFSFPTSSHTPHHHHISPSSYPCPY